MRGLMTTPGLVSMSLTLYCDLILRSTYKSRHSTLSLVKIDRKYITSVPWAVRLSWLENAGLCPFTFGGQF